MEVIGYHENIETNSHLFLAKKLLGRERLIQAKLAEVMRIHVEVAYSHI
jgi:hypothetical protein